MKKSFFNKNNPWKLCFYKEENKSKEIQGKNVLSFTKFVLGGFCPGVFGLEVFVRGVLSCHQQRYTFIDFLLMAYKPDIFNICPLATNMENMENLENSWNLKNC